MSEAVPPRDRGPLVPGASDRPYPDVDWLAVEREPDFQELVRRRRSFVIPATVFFLCWYMAFIVLAAVAPDFMDERVYEGLTVGYVLALTQFLMVLVLGIWYLRKSDRDFDPLAARIVERHDPVHAAGVEERPARAERTGRFRRRHAPATTPEPRP